MVRATSGSKQMVIGGSVLQVSYTIVLIKRDSYETTLIKRFKSQEVLLKNNHSSIEQASNWVENMYSTIFYGNQTDE